MINLGSAHPWAATEATNVEEEINRCCLQMCVRVFKKARHGEGFWSYIAKPNPQSVVFLSSVKYILSPKYVFRHVKNIWWGLTVCWIHHKLLCTALSITSPHTPSSAVSYLFLYISQTNPAWYPSPFTHAVLCSLPICSKHSQPPT